VGKNSYYDKSAIERHARLLRVIQLQAKRRITRIGVAIIGIGTLAIGLAYPAITSAVVPGVNERVSVDTNETQANSNGQDASVSGDGRFVAFESNASNLVASDTNAARDIFVRDRVAGTTVRVSESSTGTAGNSDSTKATISHDGRYVVFASYASNLVSGDTNGAYDIFIHDLNTGTTTRASTTSSGGQISGGSDWPDISADGRFVLFQNSASNIDSSISGTPAAMQVYVKDMSTGSTHLLSKSTTGTYANGNTSLARISCDGGTVVYTSAATNLVSSDTNGYDDVFVVSLGWSGDKVTNVTSGGNHHSTWPDISCNGNAIAFQSGAGNLTANDTIGPDIFKYDRLSAVITKVSVYSNGNSANYSSNYPAISEDGHYVAFETDEPFESPDTSTSTDIYVHDTEAGSTQLVTLKTSGGSGAATGYSPDISSDGSFVGYQSGSSMLVPSDTNGASDIFVSETGF